jgi:hypothetical protein
VDRGGVVDRPDFAGAPNATRPKVVVETVILIEDRGKVESQDVERDTSNRHADTAERRTEIAIQKADSPIAPTVQEPCKNSLVSRR